MDEWSSANRYLSSERILLDTTVLEIKGEFFNERSTWLEKVRNLIC